MAENGEKRILLWLLNAVTALLLLAGGVVLANINQKVDKNEVRISERTRCDERQDREIQANKGDLKLADDRYDRILAELEKINKKIEK